ncbi:MAG: enoyl-CoA hydratase/isomerase family protein [Candidatus Stahlbacteria bacterium]|nr:enoyl-CoA hydratase/isomerase family protein [Candidatus Stahlbacteria bacterium]
MGESKFDWQPAENPNDWQTIKYDPHWYDYTALIAINRPQEFNSYLLGTLKELCAAFERAMADDAVQFVVLTGIGDKAFCTGGNIHEYAEKYNKEPWGFWNWGEYYGRVFDLIMHCGMPVIARVNGAVAGGGWEFVVCCDLAIATENAKFISPGPRVGMTSVGGLSQWLPLHMSIKKASEMVLLSKEINAQEALKLGVVNDVVALDKLDEKTKEYLDRMITLSPSSLYYFKTHINWWKELNWRVTWEQAKAWFVSNIGAMEPSEGLWAFKEKRKPRMKEIREFRAKGGDTRIPFGPFISKCEKCGTEFLPQASKYCLNCGAKL